MPRQPKFALIFAPETLDHLDAIERKYHHLIEEGNRLFISREEFEL